ncbi:MAG: hypothetical protein ACPH9O_06060, partial [Akkermansiaceae bacterium]
DMPRCAALRCARELRSHLTTSPTKKSSADAKDFLVKMERVMRLTSLRAVYASEQVSSSGNLG